MSRLITSGFEIYVAQIPTSGDTAALTEVGAPDGGFVGSAGNIFRDTTTKRSGNASLGVSTTAAAYNSWTISGALDRTYWLRFYIKVTSLPSALVDIARIGAASNGIQLKTNGDLCHALATGSVVNINDGAWHRVETYIKCSATQASRTWGLRVDGTDISSGTNQSGDSITPAAVQLGFITSATGTVNFDDVALNDDQGSAQNTWPGDGYVIVLKPTADNSRGSWTGGAGGTTNLWDAINNTPPAGVAAASETDASQIKANAVATTGLFDTQTLIAAGATSGDTPICYAPAACHAEEVSTGTKSGAVGQAAYNNWVSQDAATINYGNDSGAAGVWPLFWRWGGASIFTVFSTAPVLSDFSRLRITTTTTSRVADCCFLGMIIEMQPASSTPKSGTDANSTTTEAQSIGISVPDANTAVSETIGNRTATLPDTATATEVAFVKISVTDQNGATAETGAVSVPISGTDQNGATTEGTLLVFAVTSTDSGSASSEIGSIGITVADTNGTTTESGTVPIFVNSSDSNSATTESALISISVTDTGGAITEATLLVFAVTSTDTGSASSEIGSIKITVTDANGTTTESATVPIFVNSSDSNGATTETALISVPITATDANGAVTEATLQTVQISTSDSGTDAETNLLTFLVTVTDANGSTTESLALRLTLTDTNAVVTEATTQITQISTSDANGTITEAATTNTPKSSSDANSTTTEATSQTAQISTLDTANAAELASLRLAASDSNATTSETASVSLSLTGTDSGTSVEGTSFVARPSASDSGTSTEAQSLVARPIGTDSGSSSETSIRSAIVTSTDSSGVTIELQSLRVVTGENGTSTETANLTAISVATDSGTGAETAFIDIATLVAAVKPRLISAGLGKAKLLGTTDETVILGTVDKSPGLETAE